MDVLGRGKATEVAMVTGRTVLPPLQVTFLKLSDLIPFE